MSVFLLCYVVHVTNRPMTNGPSDQSSMWPIVLRDQWSYDQVLWPIVLWSIVIWSIVQ